MNAEGTTELGKLERGSKGLMVVECPGSTVSPWVGCGEPGSGVSGCRCLLGCGGPLTVHFFSSFFSLFFISLFPVVVIKARGQDIFCSLPPRADSGSGDEGDNGRPEVRRQGGVVSLVSLWSFRYCRFLLSLEMF